MIPSVKEVPWVELASGHRIPVHLDEWSLAEWCPSSSTGDLTKFCLSQVCILYTQYLLTIISLTKDSKIYLRVGNIQFNGTGFA